MCASNDIKSIQLTNLSIYLIILNDLAESLDCRRGSAIFLSDRKT